MTVRDPAPELGFRDVGGVPTEDGRRVRTGAIFRSAMPRDGGERARVLESAAIRGVCDLRGGRGDMSPGLAPEPGDRVIALPYVPWSLVGHDRAEVAELLTAVYVEAAAEAVRPDSALSRAVRHVVLEAPRPTVVWCTGGRDRTGMVIALVLHVLGVADGAIADDYAQSAAALVAQVHGERTRAARERRGGVDAAARRAGLRASVRRLGAADLAPLQHSAPRGAILAFLDAVRRQGGAGARAQGLGIGPAALVRAQEALLEPPSTTSRSGERIGHRAL